MDQNASSSLNKQSINDQKFSISVEIALAKYGNV